MVDFLSEFKGWHGEEDVRAFLLEVWSRMIDVPRPRVLEIGSLPSRESHVDARLALDVARTPGEVGTWTGVDWREGPGVDLVGVVDLLAKDGKLPADHDLVLSISSLEHDPRWPATIRAAVAATRNGGLIALTCDGPETPAHDVGCAPAGADAGTPAGTHYAPLSVSMLVANVCAVANRDGRDVTEIHGWYERRGEQAPRSCVVARVGHV